MSWLDELDEEYAKTESKGGTHDPLPDGKYIGTITEIKLDNWKDSEDQFLAWEFDIDGHRQFKSSTLSTNGLPYLKAEIESIGGGDLSLSQFIRGANVWNGTRVDLTLKKDKTGKQRCYVNGLAEGETPPCIDTSGPVHAPVAAVADDEIPF